MNIDIRNFVDINITHHSTSTATSTRDTTVLLVDYASQDFVISSYDELSSTFIENVEAEALDYIKIYFANGGRKLHILSAATNIANQILELDDNEIVIAYPHSTSALVSAMQTLNANSSFYGVKLKLAVVRTTASITVSEVPHVLAKYSTKGEVQACIAAYLSKIDIIKVNSVKDYDYTVENLVRTEGATTTQLYEDSDNDVLQSVMNNNENVDMYLAGQVRNIGGNTKDGLDLVNEYMLIVIQQTLSEKILTVLTDKIKGEAGIAAIHTAMAQELSKYVTNGYLTTDKVWTDETLSITYNNVTYDVIEQNTPLLLGYQIKILPYSSLTEADKAAHKTPPIYLVIADSYHIRYVALTGEVY